MRLQYIASAAVLIEHSGVKVLCDPWLTDGIYGGAWYHNPPLTVVPEDFRDINYIYLSHCHPDHTDFATLERLPRVPVLLGRYAEQFLAKQLQGMGFSVIECQHDSPEKLGDDFSIQVIPADDCNPEVCGKWIGCPIADAKQGASHQIDTLAVFKGGDHVIVNVNDVPYELGKQAVARVTAQYGRPDLLCVGYAGAGPWPQCFQQLTDAERVAAAEAKKIQFIDQAKAFILDFNPRAFLPFAGQYTLGGSLVDLNDSRGVPELEELSQYFRGRIEATTLGDSDTAFIDAEDHRLLRLNRLSWYDCVMRETSDGWIEVPLEDRLAYRETLRSKALDHESDPWPSRDDVFEALKAAQSKLWRRCAVRGFVTDWRVEIAAYGLREPVFFPVTFGSEQQAIGVLTISLDVRLLMRALKRNAHWNNLEVGSLLKFTRTPDTYSRGLFNGLCYFHV